MQFDYVVNSGCSLAYGTDLEDKYSRYPFLVAKHFKAKLIDYSAPGNLNEFIASYAIAGILKLLKDSSIDKDKLLVIINWTFFTRFKYFDLNSDSFFGFTKERLFHDWFQDQVKTTSFSLEDLETYCRHHHFEKNLIYSSLREIHYMQMFLQTNNITNYVFTFPNSRQYKFVKDWLWEDLRDNKFNSKTRKRFVIPPVNEISEQIDNKKIFKTFIETLTDDNKYRRGATGHPMEEAHVDYSTRLIKFIEDLYA